MSCDCAPNPCCTPPQQCGIENFGNTFPSLVGPMGPPGGPGTFVENFAALRALDATEFTAGYEARVSGYAVINDQGGGNFSYDPASATADNDGTVLAPANNIGRWKRIYSGAINAKWFGAPTNGTNGYVNLVNAKVAAIGNELFFPSGTYTYGTTLVFSNGSIYRGTGNDQLLASGTILKYTGASDAVQVNNPINSSTPANVILRDMLIQCTVKTAGKASFADLGSTYVELHNVGVTGNAFGVILDQSELVVLDRCNFQMGVATAGLWIVNGSSRTPGASQLFTNRITVRTCNFNGGSTTVGIADDGGVAHVYENNNFNALSTQLRITYSEGLIISGNEMEGATDAAIAFKLTDLAGVASVITKTARITGNFIISGGTYCVQIDAGSIVYLEHYSNVYPVGSSVPGPLTAKAIGPLANVVSVVSGGNLSRSRDTGVIITTVNFAAQNYPTEDYVVFNNIAVATVSNNTKIWVPAWSAAVAPAIGNGTIAGSYTRNGNLITATLQLTTGTTTTYGTGAWFFSLPFTEGLGRAWVGTCFIQVAGGNTYQGVAYLAAGDNKVRFWVVSASPTNVGSASPVAWAGGAELLIFTITYGVAGNAA